MSNLYKVILLSTLLILSACGKKKEKPAAEAKVTAASCLSKNQKLSAFGKKCVTSCPVGQSFNGTRCEVSKATCGADLEFNGKICVCKNPGEVPNKENTKCQKDCADGEAWDAEKRVCLPKAPEVICGPGTKEKKRSDGKIECTSDGTNNGGDTDTDTGGDTDNGGDTDTDTGGDTDSGSDTDTDTGGDTDNGGDEDLDQLSAVEKAKRRADKYAEVAKSGFNPVESIDELSAELGMETLGDKQFAFVTLNPIKIKLKANEVSEQTAIVTVRTPQVKSSKLGWTALRMDTNDPDTVLSDELILWAGCLDADCNEVGFIGEAVKKEKSFVFKMKKNGDKYEKVQ